MNDTVSDIFAFVLKRGSIAEEVLFHDDDDEPLAGLTEHEREAIAGIEPHLRESWIGLLTACREAVWALGEGHFTAQAMRRRKTRAATMFDNEQVGVPLILDRLHTGIALTRWGADQFHVYVWVWPHKSCRKMAEQVVANLGLDLPQNEHGSFILRLDTPRAGQSFTEVGEAAAKQLWAFAHPIADAVQAAQHEKDK